MSVEPTRQPGRGRLPPVGLGVCTNLDRTTDAADTNEVPERVPVTSARLEDLQRLVGDEEVDDEVEYCEISLQQARGNQQT
ncbi:hypothetical protein EOL96_00680 [Candidatus Saccharibacteria bacterium]|nr:hypothetical protein [Candidatus Saccharibacteria bacterium]